MNSETATFASNQPSSHIAPLHSSVPRDVGEIRLMYDATLRRPLRLRNGTGDKLAPEIHTEILDRLAEIDALLRPLSLHYLGARLENHVQSGPALDGARVSQLPRVFYAYAAAVEALQGIDLDLRAGVRVVPGRNTKGAMDASIDVRAGEAALSNPDVRTAVEDYSKWAAKTWARAVASTLGPWLLGSGVTELRLAGTIRPDRSRQLDVLAGRPSDDGPLH